MNSGLIAVAIGGATGSMLRYQIGLYMLSRFPGNIVVGTLLVNVVGSFLMGVLFVLLVEKQLLDPAFRPLLLAGLLGGFTTFSAFSIELVQLTSRGDLSYAFLYAMLGVVLCFSVAWLGVTVARAI